MSETVAEYQRGQSVQLGVEAGPAHLALSCHVEQDTELSYRAYPDQERLTFHIGTDSAEITLFTHGEALDRLIFALVAARNHLQVEFRKIYAGPDAPITLFPID